MRFKPRKHRSVRAMLEAVGVVKQLPAGKPVCFFDGCYFDNVTMSNPVSRWIFWSGSV